MMSRNLECLSVLGLITVSFVWKDLYCTYCTVRYCTVQMNLFMQYRDIYIQSLARVVKSRL